MARLEFRNYSDPAALRLIPGALLQRLLTPYQSYCQSQGLNPAGLDDSDEAADQLFRFFAHPDPQMPDGLLSALHHIDDLASEHGHDLLLDSARLLDQPMNGVSTALDPRALALLAYLDRPQVFEVAHDRQSVVSVHRFQEFAAGVDKRVLPPEAEAMEALERELGAFFEGRRRSAFCRIRSYVLDEEICFVISHGRPYRSDEAVEDSLKGSRVSYRPQQHDVVKYDNRTFRLKVKAPDRGTVSVYRRVFGRLLLGDEAGFGDDAVVTLAPLVRLGTAALEPAPGMRSVELVELRWSLDSTRRAIISLQSDRLFEELETHPSLSLGMGTLIYARLLVRYDSGGRKRRIEIKPPNQVLFNRSRDERVTLAFLEERGFYTERHGSDGWHAPVVP